MSNISSEQYEKYLSLLGVDGQYIDIRYLIFKYVNAVGDYYLEEARDVDKLDLIVDGFLFFSQFELKYDAGDMVKTLLSVDDVIKVNAKHTDAQMIAVITKLLAIEMLNENGKEFVTTKWGEVLYKLAATIKPVREYEEQYGDVNVLLKEIKVRGE